MIAAGIGVTIASVCVSSAEAKLVRLGSMF
jgi:hypothetical protein